jgi:hypothetical protein
LLSGEEEPALPVVHATRFCVVSALRVEMFFVVFCWFFQPVSFLLEHVLFGIDEVMKRGVLFLQMTIYGTTKI